MPIKCSGRTSRNGTPKICPIKRPARDEAHGICLFRWEGGELWTGANPVEPKTGYWQKAPWEPKHFSFNSHFGACPACEGLGGPKSKPCPVCHGERLRPETAAVRVVGVCSQFPPHHFARRPRCSTVRKIVFQRNFHRVPKQMREFVAHFVPGEIR